MKNVTEQYKRDYLLRFHKFQKGREKFFAPHIYRKLTAQYTQAAALVKSGASVSDVINNIHPVGLNTLIMDLYVDAATIYGNKIRVDFKQQKNRLPIGFSEEIRKVIMDYFSVDVLNITEGITKTTKDLIYKIITEGYQVGLSINDIVAKLQNTELSKARARLIARTETVTSANKGAFYVAEKTGLPLNKEWLSASDSRVRKDHADINGRIVGMYDYFNVGGFNMMQPGDHGGKDGQLDVPAAEVCNCRCSCIFLPI